MAEVKHNGEATGPVLEGSHQFEIALPYGILARFMNHEGRQNRVEPFCLRRTTAPLADWDRVGGQKCLGRIEF